ncbi:MAG: matrixin family metalloprotease [Balneolaceae bacterium]|nr:matrixin family metalloprotease [Balneolaceae bacterium]
MNRNLLFKILMGVVLGLSVGYALSLFLGISLFPETEVPPCSEPITVRVGAVDERFDISPDEVEELIQEVARTWSDAADTNVIEYNEEGEIAVNLVYAEEQRLSDREEQLRDRLEGQELSIAAHEREYERMQREYERDVQQYEQESRRVQQTINQLNRWVNQMNDAGGFNERDLERYEERKSEIESLKRQLAQRESVLQRKANEINNKVTFLNEKIDDKNQLTDEYNRTFSGERQFTQGQYEWNAENRNINVFHFMDKNELRLVLAHEMGHSLGIAHVENPKSVMYRLMGSQTRSDIELTAEDIEALKKVCQSQH